MAHISSEADPHDPGLLGTYFKLIRSGVQYISNQLLGPVSETFCCYGHKTPLSQSIGHLEISAKTDSIRNKFDRPNKKKMSQKEADEHRLLWSRVGESFQKLISQLCSYGYETVIVSVGRNQYSLGSEAGEMYLSCRDIPGDFLEFCTGRRYQQENEMAMSLLPDGSEPVPETEANVNACQPEATTEVKEQLTEETEECEQMESSGHITDEKDPNQDILVVKEEEKPKTEDAGDVSETPDVADHVRTRPRRSSTRLRKTVIRSSGYGNGTSTRANHPGFLCNICGTKFQHRWQKSNHMKSHIFRYECMVDGCDAKFHCKRKLQKHCKSSHGTGLGFTCFVCSETFNHESILNTHMKQHHKAGKPWKCEKCDATFNGKFGLKSHMNSHSKDKKQVCEICGKSFRTIYKHMMWHKYGKQFRCDVCGHEYLAKESLQSHVVKMDHYSTTQTPAAMGLSQCEVCGVKIVGGYKLKRHMRIHNTDLKIYQCKYCIKRFSEKYNLRVHERIHTGTKPTCDICGAVLTSSRKLQDHIKDKHTSVA